MVRLKVTDLKIIYNLEDLSFFKLMTDNYSDAQLIIF